MAAPRVPPPPPGGEIVPGTRRGRGPPRRPDLPSPAVPGAEGGGHSRPALPERARPPQRHGGPRVRRQVSGPESEVAREDGGGGAAKRLPAGRAPSPGCPPPRPSSGRPEPEAPEGPATVTGVFSSTERVAAAGGPGPGRARRDPPLQLRVTRVRTTPTWRLPASLPPGPACGALPPSLGHCAEREVDQRPVICHPCRCGVAGFS